MATRRSFQGAGDMFVGSAAITISALEAAAEEDIEITEANAATTDVICVSLLAADMEAGVAVVGAWCSEAGKFKIRITNVGAGGLTGGAAVVKYVIIKTA